MLYYIILYYIILNYNGMYNFTYFKLYICVKVYEVLKVCQTENMKYPYIYISVYLHIDNLHTYMYTYIYIYTGYYNEFSAHAAPATRIRITFDDYFLFSTAEDTIAVLPIRPRGPYG